ncbi:MAG: YccF domain-containing protein [Clostridia bacterium]
MSFFGNLIWFLVAGFWQGLCWLLAGLLWCLTIVGIPIGRQCFKFSALSFFPFGKEVVPGGGAISTLMNLLWLVLSGFWLALGSAGIGLVLCLTIIGIPFGLQCFKLARLALTPFGAEIVDQN